MSQEREYFINNLAMLVSSGTDLAAALKAIRDSTHARRLRKTMDVLKNDLDAGAPFWRALADTGIFSRPYISLVRLGEEAGQLSKNLELIALQKQKERMFRSRIRAAMIYPVLMLIIALGIGLGITWFVLPRLTSTFLSLGLELPWVTRLLINFGSFLSVYGVVAVPAALIALILIGYFVFVFSKTKIIGEYMMLALPASRKLLVELELARLGYVLGGLLSAGLPIIEALESLGDSTAMRIYRKFYTYLTVSIAEGNSFQHAISNYHAARKLVPVPIDQMIASGEQSGQLATVLSTIGNIFEERTEVTMKNISTLLEPVLIVLVGFGVAFVAFAIILPIYSLIGSLSR